MVPTEMIGPNKPKRTLSFDTNVISLCTGDCGSCITVFYTNDLISELSGHHPALDCVPYSDLIAHIHKGTFSPEQGSNERINIDDR